MTDLQKTLYNHSTPRRKNAVFAACDDKYAFCLYVSLRTLCEYSPMLAQSADIWVASYGICQKHQDILKTIPNLRIFEYQFPGDLQQTPAIKNFTNVSFSRYELFTLLDLYENVLYLDSDVLVQKELISVFKQLTNGIGLIVDSTFPTAGGNFFKAIDGFDMQATGYNSGFIVLNRNGKWLPRVQEIRQFLYKTTLENAPALFLPDQGIINLAVQKFNMQPTALPEAYNCPASRSRKKLKQAYIIHSTGPRKFWCYYYFHDFYKWYKDWINRGGKAVSIRPKNSKMHQSFLTLFGLQNSVFFQLCPDLFAKPTKALRFAIMKWLDFR